jgi:uncharacterized damage-inducible protein DinB
MALQELIAAYAAGPAVLRDAVAGMTTEQLDARPIAGAWSTHEVVCHLTDFEFVFVDRLTSVIAEEEPTLPGRDEQKYVARLAYDRRDTAEQLQLIELCRSHVTKILGTLTEDDLSRCGIHSEAGPLTLAQLLERSTGHITHHVKFIYDKRRALGL